MNNHKTSLRHDLLYLRCIITHAIRHHQAQTPEDSLTQATLQDYLTWLTTDAMQDKQLARKLVSTYARLQEELIAEAKKRLANDTDPSAPAFHEGFLHALEQTLSFKHGADLLLDEKISREDFLESWEQVMRRLTPVEEG